MRGRFLQCAALCLAALLASAASQRPSSAAPVFAQVNKLPIGEALKKSYLDLFEFAKERQYGIAETDSIRDGLKRGQETCVSRFKQKSSQYGKEIERAQKQLKDDSGRIPELQRHELHCKIQNLRALARPENARIIRALSLRPVPPAAPMRLKLSGRLRAGKMAK